MSPEELAALLRDIIYMQAGIIADLWAAGYGGKSVDGERHAAERAAALTHWLICGLEKAPVHYQLMGECEEDAMLPLAQISADLPVEEGQEGLVVYEWAINLPALHLLNARRHDGCA